MTALVSFDRVFEVLDLQPLIAERRERCRCPDRLRQRRRARPAPPVEFDRVSFRYPSASEVSLASLESIALPAPERAGGGQDVLREVTSPRRRGS